MAKTRINTDNIFSNETYVTCPECGESVLDLYMMEVDNGSFKLFGYNFPKFKKACVGCAVPGTKEYL